ncbi:MAG: hypothetical protein ACK2T6_09260 [Anaerolineae bacterium]|jgi:hypothetical protein
MDERRGASQDDGRTETEATSTEDPARGEVARPAAGISTGMRTLSVLAGMALIIALMTVVALTFRP